MMRVFEPLPPDIEHLAKIVVDAAYKVHSSPGPGLLESVYGTTSKGPGLLVRTLVLFLIVFVSSCLCG